MLFAFPQVGPFVPYAGLGYVPPVTVFGTRNVIALGGVIVLTTALLSLWSVRDRLSEPRQTLQGLGRAANPFIDDEKKDNE